MMMKKEIYQGSLRLLSEYAPVYRNILTICLGRLYMMIKCQVVNFNSKAVGAEPEYRDFRAGDVALTG